MIVLGIETSCDETGLALYDTNKGLLNHVLFSQIKLHMPYGGVVPELASRNHIEHLIPLLEKLLSKSKLSLQNISAIAYTHGPGLIGALLTGSCFAKSLAFALNIPAIAVNHLEAHVLSAFLLDNTLKFPFLSLLVSGGHTMLIESLALGQYKILGETLDDAVGEAFDKTAKLLGFAYPGGPKLAALADLYPAATPLPFAPFPHPMCDRDNFDFSFSGLKTHARLVWEKSSQDDTAKKAIAFAFQDAIIKTLVFKCEKALAKTQYKHLVIAGGVSANKQLRKAMMEMAHKIKIYFPALEFCTDNGAMVAYTGAQYLLVKRQDADLAIKVHARLELVATGGLEPPTSAL